MTNADAGQEASYPLLPLQQGMLLHLLADPTSGIDLNQIVVTVPERLDFDAFSRAWQRVLDRHPALRTTFSWEKGEAPCQHVWSRADAVVQREDWRDVPLEQREVRFAQFLAAERHRENLLDHCPLWRVTVFEHSDDEYRFAYSGPHALMDGQSLYLVFEEFLAFYEAFCIGSDVDLPTPPPISEFVAWVQGRDRAADESYWRERFKGFAGLPTLLIPRPHVPASGRGEQRTRLPAELASRLRGFAKEHRTTLSLVVKAAWMVLLSRLCASLDVTFGEVRWGRRSTVRNAGSMIGLFINTIPVRVSMTPDTTVQELLHIFHEDQGAVRDHEHAGLQDIQRWAGVQPGSSLFETLLIFDHADFETPWRKKGGRWEKRRFANHERTSLPITLNVHAEPELEVQISYDRARFDDAFIGRTLDYFGAVLEQFVADPLQRVSALDLLPREERQRLLVTWNQTARDVPADGTIPRLFEQQVERTPHRCALVCATGQLTYQELDRRANRVARYLRKLGVGPDRLVGVCLDRSEDMLVSLLGTMKAGGAYVPIDPDFPSERIRLMVDDASPAVILTSGRHTGRFTGSRAQVVSLDGLDRCEIELESPHALDLAASPEHLAYVIYTSGSTGRPKGVMLTQGNVVNCFAGIDDVLGAPTDGTWLAVTSISFDISVLELFYTLTHGFTIVLAGEPASAESEVSALGALIARHAVTHLQCTPSLARMMLGDPATREALRAVRVLMLGGEALPEELLRRLGTVQGRRILNMYGPTETTIWSTWARVDGATAPVPIGRPLGNTQVYVVDPQLTPTPTGVPGELLIGGRGVARGYLNQPELTAERFRPDPFSGRAGARVYRTGDRVRYRGDGTLEYLGRLDHQVKIRGHRIELGEIEASLRRFPGVEDAAAIVREDVGAEPRLVAYYILRPGAVFELKELRGFLAKRLPTYMLPQDFTALDAFPLTPNGKLDRMALPRPERDRASGGTEFVAPRNAMEEAMAAVWAQVLTDDYVSVRDNFFEKGGDSVNVVHLSRMVRERFGVDVPLAALFQHPTIEEMAALIPTAAARHEKHWATVEEHHYDGHDRPLVAFHGVENIFGHLPRHLPRDRPFVIITTRSGFDGRVPPYFPCRSVEQMADYYLRELRAIQPRGPYSLLGFCLGGLIAVEVARRLASDGETVDFVGLINSLPHSMPPPIARATEGRLRRHLEQLAQLDLRGRFDYVFRRVVETARASTRSVLGWPRRARTALGLNVNALLVRAGFPADPEILLKRIGAFGWDMAARYKPLPYEGRLWLFYGSHGPADAEERWARLAVGGFEGYKFDADHYGLMAEPHVSDLAARLNECLQRAEALANVASARATVETPPLEPAQKPAALVTSCVAYRRR